MKKLLCILLIVITALSVCACQSQGDIANNETQATNTSNKEDKNTDNSTQTSDDKKEKIEASIEKTIILDENGLTITANDLRRNGSYTILELEIKNNTGNNISVSTSDIIAVNGLNTECTMHETIDNGSTKTAELSLSAFSLKMSQIETITDFEIKFYVHGEDDPTIHYYTSPAVLKTSAYGKVDNKVDTSGETIYDQNNIRLILKDTIEYNGSKYTRVYVENNTGENIYLSVSQCQVNDIEVDAYMENHIVTFDKSMSYLSYSSTDLKNNSIEEINKVSLSVKIEGEGLDVIDTTQLKTITY